MKSSALFVLLGLLTLSATAQEWARAKLEKSPRHQEWAQVTHGGRTVDCFVVYPEVKDKAPTVLIIHENRGLTDWVRSVADAIAQAGYIAIAPDLLSGMAPHSGKTSDFPSEDAAMRAIYALPADQVTADLKAVADYALKLPASNGKLAVAGFCWGGGQSFRLATNEKDLRAAFVFYGPPPDQAAIARIPCPVYGFYAGNDSRIDATIPKTTELMKEAGKVYQPVAYEGAGHGFMRSGQEPNAQPANQRARNQAWQRLLELLKGI